MYMYFILSNYFDRLLTSFHTFGSMVRWFWYGYVMVYSPACEDVIKHTSVMDTQVDAQRNLLCFDLLDFECKHLVFPRNAAYFMMHMAGTYIPQDHIPSFRVSFFIVTLHAWLTLDQWLQLHEKGLSISSRFLLFLIQPLIFSVLKHFVLPQLSKEHSQIRLWCIQLKLLHPRKQTHPRRRSTINITTVLLSGLNVRAVLMKSWGSSWWRKSQTVNLTSFNQMW